MAVLLKVVRNLMGSIIVFLDIITRWTRVKRTDVEKQKINDETKNLTLYHFFACPFCVKTRRAIYKLNINVEKKEASGSSPYRKELLEGASKIQVPCLLINHDDGRQEWMLESKRIIDYLNQRFKT